MIHEIQCIKTTAGAAGLCERCTLLLEYDDDGWAIRPGDGASWYVIGGGHIRGWGDLDGPCYVVKGDGLLTEYYVPKASWDATV